MGNHADESIYRRAFESSSVGLALLGLDGRIQHINRTLVEMLGQPAADLLGTSLDALLHPRDRHAVLRAFDRAQRQHEDLECGEVRLATSAAPLNGCTWACAWSRTTMASPPITWCACSLPWGIASVPSRCTC